MVEFQLCVSLHIQTISKVSEPDTCLHTAIFIQLKWTVYRVLRCRCWMSRTLVTTGQGVLDNGGKECQPCLTDGGKENQPCLIDGGKESQPCLTDGGKESQPCLTDGGKEIVDL